MTHACSWGGNCGPAEDPGKLIPPGIDVSSSPGLPIMPGMRSPGVMGPRGMPIGPGIRGCGGGGCLIPISCRACPILTAPIIPGRTIPPGGPGCPGMLGVGPVCPGTMDMAELGRDIPGMGWPGRRGGIPGCMGLGNRCGGGPRPPGGTWPGGRRWRGMPESAGEFRAGRSPGVVGEVVVRTAWAVVTLALLMGGRGKDVSPLGPATENKHGECQIINTTITSQHWSPY